MVGGRCAGGRLTACEVQQINASTFIKRADMLATQFVMFEVKLIAKRPDGPVTAAVARR